MLMLHYAQDNRYEGILIQRGGVYVSGRYGERCLGIPRHQTGRGTGSSLPGGGLGCWRIPCYCRRDSPRSHDISGTPLRRVSGWRCAVHRSFLSDGVRGLASRRPQLSRCLRQCIARPSGWRLHLLHVASVPGDVHVCRLRRRSCQWLCSLPFEKADVAPWARAQESMRTRDIASVGQTGRKTAAAAGCFDALPSGAGPSEPRYVRKDRMSHILWSDNPL